MDNIMAHEPSYVSQKYSCRSRVMAAVIAEFRIPWGNVSRSETLTRPDLYITELLGRRGRY